MNVGFIGLGRMGAGMAANLLKAGHKVTVYNRTQAKADALAAGGAIVADDISGACGGDAVFTMLANDEAVENVVLARGGIVEHLAPDAIHISSSTISVALSERLARAHADARAEIRRRPGVRTSRGCRGRQSLCGRGGSAGGDRSGHLPLRRGRTTDIRRQ